MLTPEAIADGFLSREKSFAALKEVAERFASRGRIAKSGPVKSVLMMYTSEPFDEQSIGFSSFREFLEAAQSDGVVTIAAAGPDVIVSPAGSNIPPPQPSALPRFRREVWDAFVKWGRNQEDRFWHTGDRRVVPYGPTPDEALVKIEVITVDRLKGWAEEFARHSEVEVRPRLETALKAAKPIREFTTEIRAVRLDEVWSRSQAKSMTDHIRAWAETHHVPINDLLARPRPEYLPPPTTTGCPPVVAANPTDVDRLRADVHRYVDGMTESELLTISVPIRLIRTK
jgi:hypothetical protein